jgi:hypothetical protein
MMINSIKEYGHDAEKNSEMTKCEAIGSLAHVVFAYTHIPKQAFWN